MTNAHLLLLAGGGEARDIARALSKTPLRVTASLHEDTRGFGPLVVPTRTGGFGGDAGFEYFLKNEAIGAVLDVTHSFATAISFRTAQVCALHGLPYAQVLRPAWQAEQGDAWIHVPDIEAVADVIPAGAKVFTTTGRPSVVHLETMRKTQIFVRQMQTRDPHPQTHVSYVQGTPPFSVQEEAALFASLGITHLVVKNTGGQMGQSKLLAARHLGLPVVLIDRPAQPDALKLDTVDQAVEWALAQ